MSSIFAQRLYCGGEFGGAEVWFALAFMGSSDLTNRLV
jgi:hypothetical protein